MIIKDPKELEILKEGGKILATVLNMVVKKTVPGVSAQELDLFAEAEIRKAGGEPSFKNYKSQLGDPPFPASLCVSVNNEVVHGIPYKEKILKEGDIVGLDLGVKFKGLYTDMAITVAVGTASKLGQDLINAATKSLKEALSFVKPGNYTGDIGHAIESTAKQFGFSVVRELVGHGVGKAVHEAPEVPCFGKPGTGTKLVEGMVLAIEPMVNEKGWKIIFAEDNWTILTEDGGLSAHMEHTILITRDGFELLTQNVV